MRIQPPWLEHLRICIRLIPVSLRDRPVFQSSSQRNMSKVTFPNASTITLLSSTIITSAFQSWVPYTSNVIEDLKAKGMMHNHHLSRAVANVTGTCLQTCLPTNACLMARNWFVLIRNTQARHAMYVAASTIAWVITHMDSWRSENGTVLSVALTLIETLTLQSISKKQVWL